jgi:hypothetical protein
MPASSKTWGDLQDGTFRNPILPGDYADPDVVRDGDRYYMITSSFQLCPGMPILESEDLVNWRTIGHAIPDPGALDPDLSGQRMAGYNLGVYAGSLRKLEWNETTSDGGLIRCKRWFVHTTLFTSGFIVSTADDIRGPWTARYMEDLHGRPLTAPKWDDPCPYWEFNDDGTLKAAYLVASKLPGAWYLHLFRMSVDGIRLLDGDLDFMTVEGDTTRLRTGATPDLALFRGSSSGDPKGELIDRKAGRTLRAARSLQDGHEADIAPSGDFLSVLNATHFADREGTVTNDYFSAEASKILRFGPETEAGQSRFDGRHGPHQRVCDYVYHFHSEYWDGFRMPILRRAKSVYGDKFDASGAYLGPGGPGDPGSYETQRILVDLKQPVPTREPNQGGFVDVPASLSTDGREHWYFLTHHGDKEVYPECRPSSLLPVTWIDGWPMPGIVQGNAPRCTGTPDVAATPYDGTPLLPDANPALHHPHQPLIPGVMQWYAPKPPLRAPGCESLLQASDNFGAGPYAGPVNSGASELSPLWQWNHSPIAGAWSLEARLGWLRLTSLPPLQREPAFFGIRNVLSQGYLAVPRVRIETRVDFSRLALGDEAGLAHFDGGKHSASLGLRRFADGRFRMCHNLRPCETTPPTDASIVILRSEIQLGGQAIFSYSIDNGLSFVEWPVRYTQRSSGHRGDRIGVYAFAADGRESKASKASLISGYAEFDYFRYEFPDA